MKARNPRNQKCSRSARAVTSSMRSIADDCNVFSRLGLTLIPQTAMLPAGGFGLLFTGLDEVSPGPDRSD